MFWCLGFQNYFEKNLNHQIVHNFSTKLEQKEISSSLTMTTTPPELLSTGKKSSNDFSQLKYL